MYQVSSKVQQDESRNQLQETLQKKKKEAKQYSTKQPMDHRRNQRGNKKYLETNENGNTIIQNLGNIPKAVLRGSFRPTSGSKKSLQ